MSTPCDEVYEKENMKTVMYKKDSGISEIYLLDKDLDLFIFEVFDLKSFDKSVYSEVIFGIYLGFLLLTSLT